MKKIIWWIIGIVIVVVIVIFATRGGAGDTGPIKIGFIGPLTGDGASFGEPLRNSIDMAVS